MRIVGKILKWGLVALLVVIIGLAGWLYLAPPALIRVGTGYSAKIVCSNVFIAGRDAEEVLALDVQAPGHWLLGYITAYVDRDAGSVSAALLGVFGESLAVFRDGAGCAVVPDGNVEAAALPSLPELGTEATAGLWPQGNRVEAENAAIAAILDDPEMTGPNMRAVVVVHDGRIVAERYGPGFDAGMPLLGWSMTKTVTSAIIGTLVGEEVLSLDQDALLEEWSGDERAQITIANLLAMSSGLQFNEDYGDVTDVTRMLYLEPDMAEFAADKPLIAPPGDEFSYSSGTTVILSRIWQNAFDSPAQALAWPREALFGPIGMETAVLEPDARGTFVGSSYLYATARDWARFGLLLLEEGRWEGGQVLPEGFVAWMREPVPAANGAYGRHVWLRGPDAGTPEGEDPDMGFDLPDDAFWMLGHDGQSMVIVPSLDLVVVRLGLTPSSLGYKPQRMVEAITRVVE